MKFDVTILAGGLGTRLSSVVSDVPKPMAPVCGVPFLDHILKRLPLANIGRLILAVGHKYEVISDYYGESYKDVPIVYSIEEKPLGTGGGIGLAMKHVQEPTVLILNGDTCFDLDYESFWQQHSESGKLMTIALKQVQNPDRYGTVLLQEDTIVRFEEKKEGLATGLINGGVYWAQKELIDHLPKKEKYSFEEEILQVLVKQEHFGGCISKELFIDIGIPEDYERAQTIFAE
mgnify:FL=1